MRYKKKKMTQPKTADGFIREFFSIGDTPEEEKEMDEIRACLKRVHFNDKEDICRINDDADGLYFLESGTAAVLDSNGDQINLLHRGQYFGEYAVLFGEKRLSTVRSVGKTVLLRLDTDDVLKFFRRRPKLYGDMVKKLYKQLTGKHRQILTLSRMRKGILQHPDNLKPMSPRKLALQYGALFLPFVFFLLFPVPLSDVPVFVLPIIYLLASILLTKRTVGSLIFSCMFSAVLLFRSGVAAGFTDALMETMGAPDNVFTVLVMALMGGIVALIEASGAVTAFSKLADKYADSRKNVFLFSIGVMAITAVDDGLNVLCAASATEPSAQRAGIPRESYSLPFSILPTVLCSFFPLSLWGIFVFGTLNVSAGENSIKLLLQSIPFNFYSILAVIAMLLFATGKLPPAVGLKKAEDRVKNGGDLWPAGSEPYLIHDKPEVWGKPRNVLLPILFLAIASLTVRSLYMGRLTLDSAAGLVAAVLFMLPLYCGQRLMTPEQFTEILLRGFADTTLAIVLYLLTICFSTLLTQLSLDSWFEHAASFFGEAAPLFPAALFLLCYLMTILLGSSWAVYAISFPIVLKLAAALGANSALCIGAVCAAGIAGEHSCLFTAGALTVGSLIGCVPDAVRDVRIKWSVMLSFASLLLYTIAGILAR